MCRVRTVQISHRDCPTKRQRRQHISIKVRNGCIISQSRLLTRFQIQYKQLHYTWKHETISRWIREAVKVEAKEIAETKGKEEMAKIAEETLTSISETAPVLEDTITDPQFDSGWIDQSLQGRSINDDI